jgi:endogenous inhibitor of DNA gyrase (YacG/DUF329 family)
LIVSEINRVIRCPRCRKSARFDASNEFRPFCSALCKNEDIIGWAEQSYRLPGPPLSSAEDIEALAAELEKRVGKEDDRD